MPILKPEADVFPEELFDLAADEHPWWVAHVRSRQEKLASREARQRGIPCFLPKYEKETKRDGRKRISSLPLFPGYLFFRGMADTRYEMLRTNLCVRILEVTDQGALQSDLLQIRHLQLAGLPFVPAPDVRAGDPVRITEGPFVGVVGVVLKEKGKTRLMVSVRFIHRSVCVELPRDAVVPEVARPSRRAPSSRSR